MLVVRVFGICLPTDFVIYVEKYTCVFSPLRSEIIFHNINISLSAPFSALEFVNGTLTFVSLDDHLTDVVTYWILCAKLKKEIIHCTMCLVRTPLNITSTEKTIQFITTCVSMQKQQSYSIDNYQLMLPTVQLNCKTSQQI